MLCVASTLTEAAQSGSIVQFIRRIPMSAREPTPPREYLIDLGLKHGIRGGDTLSVTRLLGVVHAQSGQPTHIIRLPLGEVSVVSASDFVSLVRTKRMEDPDRLPAINYRVFMLGDQVLPLQSGN